MSPLMQASPGNGPGARLDDATRRELDQLVRDNPVLLFMKGTRAMPQCGFSAQVVRILDRMLPSYHTVDVLAAPAIREGIKEFSQWPTLPQLYIKGEFIGGCDIVKELFASGELHQRLVKADVGALADNPAAAQVKPLDVVQAKAMLERGELQLFDVRPGPERARAHIAASHALDDAGQDLLFSLDKKTPVALYCHHGMRSRSVAEQLLEHGFTNVYNLEGGIDAWSAQVDPSIPRY